MGVFLGGGEAGVADAERARAPVRGVEDGVVGDLAEARREAAIAAEEPEQRRRAARRAVERDPSSSVQGASLTSSTVRTGPRLAMATPGTARSGVGDSA